MSDLLPLALAVAAVLAASAAFTIAYRRSSSPAWRENVERAAAEADKPSEVPVTITSSAAVEAIAEEVAEPPSAAVLVAEVQEPVAVEYVEATPDEQGVTRRIFLNRALLSLWGTFLAGFGIASLAFLWPRVKGGFGSVIDVGDIDELLAKVLNADGTVSPLAIPDGRAYIVPILDESVAGSQFEANETVIGAGAAGLVGLYHRCVHLGCRVPWCGPSQGFECPCHGSKYNSIGEYIAGPAPRNLDRFVISVNSQNRLVMRTGDIIETSRAPRKSVKYPQGPSCI